VEAVQPAVLALEVTLPDDHHEPFGMHPGMPGEGQGSGFVVTPTGLVVTNAHVVADALTVTARLPGKREPITATVLGLDRDIDIALLQLPDDRVWPYVALGDSSALRVGDWVVALGNPLGLGLSATAGIVGGKGRVLGHDVFGSDDFIQTDAAINQGNSGGPLFALDGKVVGMSTAIVSGANTVGFAIPSDLIERVIPDLMTHGKVSRGYIGLDADPITDELAAALGTGSTDGALVAQVFEDTPADRYGLRAGDIIVSLDDRTIDSPEALIVAVGTRRPDEVVRLTIVRGTRERELRVKLAERPGAGESAAHVLSQHVVELPRFGVSLAPLSPQIAADSGVQAGVLVRSVATDGPAAGRLRPGDILLEVGQRAVVHPSEAARALARIDATAFLLIHRNNERVFVAIPAP
jgi:serine protease Do